MHGVEEWMQEFESKAGDITSKFLNVSSIGGFAINIIILAFMPAIGEELLFRGLVMKWIGKSLKNIHINIIITAIIFSAFHLQFYGFLPRFLLGVLLGYTYYWSQSLWASIWLHFTNNAVTVSIYYWAFNSGTNIDPEEVGTTDSLSILVISVVIFSSILWWIYNQRIKENNCI
jgi:hypothetical protein